MGFNFKRYYFLNPGDAPIQIPFAERYSGGGTRDLIEQDDMHVMETGRIIGHKESSRRRWRFPYRMNPTNRAFMETLHKATNGSVKPFYFLESIDRLRPSVFEAYIGPSLRGSVQDPLNAILYPEAVLVRKETNFAPRELDTPASVDGVMVRFDDYILELIEEPPRVVIGGVVSDVYSAMFLPSTSGLANYAHLLYSVFPEPLRPIVSATIFIDSEYLQHAIGSTDVHSDVTFTRLGSSQATLLAANSISSSIPRATYSATISALDFPGGAHLFIDSTMFYSLFQSFSPPLEYRIYDIWIEYTYV